jgi:hypothetical protein
MLGFKRRHHVDFQNHFDPILERLKAQDLLSVSSHRCTLTMAGMMVADAIADLFAEHIKT